MKIYAFFRNIWWELLDFLFPKTYVGHDVGGGYETLVILQEKRNGLVVIVKELQEKRSINSTERLER